MPTIVDPYIASIYAILQEWASEASTIFSASPGIVNMGGGRITGLPTTTPQSPSDAVSYAVLQQAISNLAIANVSQKISPSEPPDLTITGDTLAFWYDPTSNSIHTKFSWNGQIKKYDLGATMLPSSIDDGEF